MAADSWVLYLDQWYRLGADGVMLNNSWFRDGEKPVSYTHLVVKDVESDEALRYTSSAPDILEVSQDGELTAKKAGEAVITVTAGYGGASGSISVRVSEPEEKDIFNIRLTLDRDVLHEGEVCGYQVLVEPEYTSGTWSVTSSDPGVLEVLDGGKIKAVAPGMAKVTARETVDPDGKRCV